MKPTMRLHHGEPSFGPGESQPLAAAVRELIARKHPPRGAFLLAIDGRSSNGKSALADRIAAVVPGASIVHTDDLAWWHSRFGWDDLLISGVIEPLRRGQAVDYRPPAWDARNRSGSITVPAEAKVVVIGGVGAGRRSLAECVDAVIWVQTDVEITEARNRARVQAGEIDQTGYEGWMSEEVPFQASERTWERADLIVSGAPGLGLASDIVVLRG